MKNPMKLSSEGTFREPICTLPVITALVAMALGLSTVAKAEHVFNIKQQIADAYFSSTDASRCIVTDVNVVASSAVLRFPPDRRQPSSSVFVMIS